MLSWFIFSQAFALWFFFTWFIIQDQLSVWSCTMQAVSHCLNLEAWWNATKGSDLRKEWKYWWYWFSDKTGAQTKDVVDFVTSMTWILMEKIWLSFIQSGEKFILSESSKQEIINALASWKKLYLWADLDWKWSTWYAIQRTETVYWHATCWFNTTTWWIEFVNSWWFFDAHSIWLINWDDLIFGEVWTIERKTPPPKPMTKKMKIKKQRKEKTLQKKSKKLL